MEQSGPEVQTAAYPGEKRQTGPYPLDLSLDLYLLYKSSLRLWSTYSALKCPAVVLLIAVEMLRNYTSRNMSRICPGDVS